MGSHIEAVCIVALDGQFGNLTCLRIKTKHIYIIAILGRKVDLSVGPRPVYTLNARIEVLGEWCNLLGGDIVEEQFVLCHARCDGGRQLTADAIKCLRIASKHYLLAIRRERAIAQELCTYKQGVDLQCLGVHHKHIAHSRWALAQARAVADNEQLRAVLRDV